MDIKLTSSVSHMWSVNVKGLKGLRVGGITDIKIVPVSHYQLQKHAQSYQLCAGEREETTCLFLEGEGGGESTFTCLLVT